MNTELHFSSKTNERATPQVFYDQLNKKHNFNLDPCSTIDNHKCFYFLTEADDWLASNWETYWENSFGIKSRVFCNPPYWRWLKDRVKKASEEIKKEYCDLIVMLIPSRTDTRYFHDYIYKKDNVEVEFIKWRLKFWDAKNAAPFPSMLVIFK